jgi:pyruvate/2-oxoglutarate dehydrogenase complex dihydrolipoamide dehydrogenase (E3) component
MNMPQLEKYEVLVLGSGEGGKYLAWQMAGSGRRTAVVERKLIGGSCPNINCLPSKNEIWSAKVADLVHHAAKFGMVTGPTTIDMGRVRKRKRDMVEGLIAMHLDKYRVSGAELIMGAGRFVAPKTLEVRLNDGGSRLLAGDRVFLNLGTRATMPPIPGLADAGPMRMSPQPIRRQVPSGRWRGQIRPSAMRVAGWSLPPARASSQARAKAMATASASNV